MKWLPILFFFNSICAISQKERRTGNGYQHRREAEDGFLRSRGAGDGYPQRRGKQNQKIPVFTHPSSFGGDISLVVRNRSHQHESIGKDTKGPLKMKIGDLKRDSENQKDKLSSRPRKKNERSKKKIFRKHRRRRLKNRKNKRRRNLLKHRSYNTKDIATVYMNSSYSHQDEQDQLSQSYKYTEASQKQRSNHPKNRKYPRKKAGYPPKKGGYPPKKGGYPPKKGGYPAKKEGYPPKKGGYSPKKEGYPPKSKRYPPKDRGGFRPNQPNRNKWNSPKPRADPDAPSRYKSLDTSQTKVQKHVIRIHNLMRAKVVPPAADMLAVSWYSLAAGQAQNWAEQCSEDRELDHPAIRWTSRYGNCGQNIHITYRKRRWAHVVRYWWSSKRYFSYGYDDNNATEVGAYTQMAWYNSHQIGCGFAQCTNNNGKIFYKYVCNYCPAGNDPTRIYLPYKHGHQCSSCSDSCRSICTGDGCRLCTNGCPYSDLWLNCHSLNIRWHNWLCNTKTILGVKRFTNCRATCQCQNKIT